jgi:hypothetical protein
MMMKRSGSGNLRPGSSQGSREQRSTGAGASGSNSNSGSGDGRASGSRSNPEVAAGESVTMNKFLQSLP